MAPSAMTRRRFLIGGGTVAGTVALAGAGYAVMPWRWKNQLGLTPDPYIPDAAEGRVRLETVTSQARGQDVDLFTAVPAGYGDGEGLPVVVVLHGGSATAADFAGFGFPRFLTAAVDAGAPPFVLAGADGGVLRWERDPTTGDDPQRMVLEEMPVWLADRGFDSARRALWGWSMGGYGVLRIAEVEPGWAAAVAAFSPAISEGDLAFDDLDAFRTVPLGLWCGTDDPFHEAVVAFADALPKPPEIESYTPGGHTRVYWNDQTLEAFGFLARHLA